MEPLGKAIVLAIRFSWVFRSLFEPKYHVITPVQDAAYETFTYRAETEHIVPVENFGRTFVEWREGHPLCVHSDDSPFKGRRCAQLASEEYREMEADMHNLYPAIGCVNAARGNRNFDMFSADTPSSLESLSLTEENQSDMQFGGQTCLV